MITNVIIQTIIIDCLGLSGLEPPTSRLSGVRSNRLSYKPIFPAKVLTLAFSSPFGVKICQFSRLGGDKRDRTVDPLLAKQVLSQLSYTPVRNGGPKWARTTDLTIISRAL